MMGYVLLTTEYRLCSMLHVHQVTELHTLSSLIIGHARLFFSRNKFHPTHLFSCNRMGHSLHSMSDGMDFLTWWWLLSVSENGME